MRVVFLAAVLALGCAEVLDVMLTTAYDGECMGAAVHITDCCPAFKPATIDCTYSTKSSRHEGAISKQQGQCIQSLNCFAVAAQIKTGYVCGVRTSTNDNVCDDGTTPQTTHSPPRPIEQKGE